MAKRWKYDLETEKLTACASAISDGMKSVSALQKKIQDKIKRQKDKFHISEKLRKWESDYQKQCREIQTKLQDMDTVLEAVPGSSHSWRTRLCDELQRNTDILTERNNDLTTRFKSLGEYQRQENTRLTKEIDGLKKMLHETQLFTQDLQIVNQEIEGDLKSKLSEAESKYQTETDKISQLKTRLQKVERERTEQDLKIERLTNDNSELRRLKSQLADKQAIARETNTKLKTEIDKLSKTNDSLKKSLSDLQKEKEKTEETFNNKLKEAKTQFQKETDTTKKLKIRLEEFDQFWRSQELNDCITPAEIAQKMKSLYEHEWTDAMNSLKYTKTEACAEEELLGLLKIVFEQCQQIARTINFENIQKAMDSPAENPQDLDHTDLPNYGASLSTVLKQQITEMRRQRAQLALKIIKSALTSQVKLPNDYDDLTAYYNKCVEVCWFVAIQDPPMFMNFNPRDECGTFFDVNETGEIYADGLVWPALLEHEHGPVLVKGVVNGTRSRAYMRNIKPTGRSRSRSQDSSRIQY